MKISKKILLAAVVLPLTFGSMSVLADGGKGHKGRDNGPKIGLDMQLIKKLDLTEEQKIELKELRKASEEERKEARDTRHQGPSEEMKQQRKAVTDLLLADTFDQAKANTIALEMATHQAERQVKMLEKQHQILSILTPEQKQKLLELQQERAEKSAERMQKHMEE
ncbi:CpxP family protein [Marinomonas dokdonensis]|uniref:CpxP family protein n=1 Tax=Marinomonas dokdonensis TaxID=328224 RepID=UPI004055856A